MLTHYNFSESSTTQNNTDDDLSNTNIITEIDISGIERHDLVTNLESKIEKKDKFLNDVIFSFKSIFILF